MSTPHYQQEKSEAIQAERAESLVENHEKYEATRKLDYSGAGEKTDPEEIKLVKRLDWFIMPMIWAMYWLNYLDRNAITLARLDDMEADLGINETQYQTCVSILFVGYILGQVPSNMLLTRLRPSWYMGFWMGLWAIVSALTALAKDYKGLLLTRFFLGVTEAPFYPGALYILSIFYTRKEIATRISILYTGNILATAFAGLIAIGVYNGMGGDADIRERNEELNLGLTEREIDEARGGVAGLTGWQWLFILQGAVTFVIAIMGAFILPDFPLTTKWLSPEQRKLAHERIERDTVDLQEKGTTWQGLLQALKDYRVWLFCFMQHMHLASNGFKNFFPSVVETLGYSRNVTMALTCPPYLIAGAITIFLSWSSGKYNERTWHITGSKAVAIVGFVLAAATLNPGARYFAMVVFAIGTYGVNSIILGWVSATCSQTPEKKAVALSLVNTIAVIAFIWTPYLWSAGDDGRYALAMGTSAGFSLITALMGWVMRIDLMKTNKKMREAGWDTKNFYAY